MCDNLFDISDLSLEDEEDEFEEDVLDGESVFSKLLRHQLAKCIYVDVVKGKRDSVLLKLNCAQLALEKKDYTAACVFLCEGCEIINKDEYHDEYQCEAFEFGILLFSASVTCALAKYYSKAEELLLQLLSKFPNMLFYYVLALVYLYQLKLSEAESCLEKIIMSFGALSQQEMLWPWTDVSVANLKVEEFKRRVLALFYFVAIAKEVEGSCKPIVYDEKRITNKFSSVEKSYKEVKLNNNKRQHIGRFLRSDVYSLIRNSLDSLLQIRLSNFPDEYKIAAKSAHAKLGEHFGLITNEAKKITRHKLIQASAKIQNAQTQIYACKTIHKSAQTAESGDVGRLELQHVVAKLESAENNIANLKTKKLELEETLKKEEHYYHQEKEKWIIKDQQNEINLTKLRACVEVLEDKHQTKGSQLTQAHQQLSDCSNFLTKFHEGVAQMQRKYYESFVLKCQNTVEILAGLLKHMANGESVMQAEILSSMNQWEAALHQGLKMQDKLFVNFEKIQAALFENQFSAILDMAYAPLLPEEPHNPADQYLRKFIACSCRGTSSFTKEKHTQTFWTDNSSPKAHPTPQIQTNHRDVFRSLSSAISTSSQVEKPLTETKKASIKSLAGLSSLSSSLNYDCPESSLKNRFRNQKDAKENASIGSKKPTATESESSNASSKKLLAYVKSKLPDQGEAEILKALNTFREQNDGKLTGKTLHCILYNVRSILGLPQPSWEEMKPSFMDWNGSNGEISCSICFSNFEESPVTVLKCKHKFHIKCIRKWLTENSVCAICRIHVTMDEDYPPLKH